MARGKRAARGKPKAGPAQHTAGRPARGLDDKQVRQFAQLAAVLSLEQVADFFEMSADTLRRLRREQPAIDRAYKKGKAEAIAGVATGLLALARKGNLTAQIFYLKTQAGWREKDREGDAGPIDPQETARKLRQALRAMDVADGLAE